METTKTRRTFGQVLKGLWTNLLALFVGLIMAGCGGAPFVYGIPDSDGGTEASLGNPEREAGLLEDAPDGHKTPDGRPSPDESEASAPDAMEASDAASAPDVSQHTEAGPDAALSCTPIASTSQTCGLNKAIIDTPNQWCWLTGFGTNPQGLQENTPTRCRCQETYDCACIMAALGNPSCGGASDPNPARCSDAPGYPVVECP